jgi:hypothetical protein
MKRKHTTRYQQKNQKSLTASNKSEKSKSKMSISTIEQEEYDPSTMEGK